MVLGQLLLALAVLIAGVIGAAVLHDREDDDVLKSVSATRAAVTAQKTFRSTFALEVAGGGLNISSTGELFIDNEKKAQSGHVQVPGAGTLELRQVDEVIYVHIPPGRPGAQGKSWIAVPASDAGAIGSQDPLEFLQVLAGAKDIDEVGEEDVNGTSTTHYSLVVDREDLADAVARSPRASALPPGVLDQVKDVKTDVWIDDEDLARRLRIELKVQSVTVRSSFEFLDYGKPVDVTAPPADDVLQLTNPQQLGQLVQGSG